VLIWTLRWHEALELELSCTSLILDEVIGADFLERRK
jgi:hypothetical protein